MKLECKEDGTGSAQIVDAAFRSVFGCSPKSLESMPDGCVHVQCHHERPIDLGRLSIEFNGMKVRGAVDITDKTVRMHDVQMRRGARELSSPFHIGLCEECGKGYCSSW